MAFSDALVVGEGWISEHYFGTDAKSESFQARVLARRKAWEENKESGTVRTRVGAARAELLSAFATLDASSVDDAQAVADLLFSVLGYGDLGRVAEVDGPIHRIRAAGLEGGADLALVRAKPIESVDELLQKDAESLLVPFALDEKTEIASVSRLLSTLFVEDEPPAFALVLAGRSLLIAERERWPEGRYLYVDLQLVLERNDDKRGGEVDRALTCVSAESLAPDADGDIWWSGTLDESRRHTVGVSQDLRDGVRLSIEIIANEVVYRRRVRGLEPLPAEQAQDLAKQSLRFLYRILFLLYAESSPELGVLPAGDAAYDTGYSLDRLRDLTLVELVTEHAQSGTHLYESLAVLFGLVDRGHDGVADSEDGIASIEGLTFRSLRADLFRPVATAHIDEVALGNEALQQVLRHLLLSKEAKGRDRGFISYAELGINQLGAVYEGLMSYTGFFAETDLYEVAKGGDSSKGSWVVPTDRIEGISSSDFVMQDDPITGEPKPVMHQRGAFVFRLAGRERQQSASYYTPEVLTKFVVSQALEELLDQDGRVTSADEILSLTVCEPALGSGAFAIEAVRQLAEAYLQRRQDELGERIEAEDYPRELQRVKAYIALHQVYGVDLNATAVELAEISLWLDTMVEGLEAPWFGLHLRRGNSLIGARKSVYRRDQVADKSWLAAVPMRVRPDGTGDLGEDTVGQIRGRVPHFLLPAVGWGAAADVGKDIKELVPDKVALLKDWRKKTKAKPTKPDVDRLVALGERVEILWELASQRLRIADEQIRRQVPVWGSTEDVSIETYVTREQIETSLADPDGAYRRLRLVMDAWCALSFWPLTESDTPPPSLDQWYGALERILGTDTVSAKVAKRGDASFADVNTWDQLADAEVNDRIFAGADKVADILTAHPWLSVCRRVATEQGFFHWELEYSPVFASGGFDLQVGNPPWVRPRTDVEALLAEGDPWWQLAVRASQVEKSERRAETLKDEWIRKLTIDGTVEVVCLADFLGDPVNFPTLAGLQPDLYRCFMATSWAHQAAFGVSSLIHLESHFTDEKAGIFRAETYRRLLRHWQFINEHRLFEIQDQKTFGVNIYGRDRGVVGFLNASGLYHPDTVGRSQVHDGSGEEPGFKDGEGRWDTRPHASRINYVEQRDLLVWHQLLEDQSVPVGESRMVYAVNRSTAESQSRLATAARLEEVDLDFSRGWDESIDRKAGFFETRWGAADSWDEVILQGPHFFVATPFYKRPNSTMLHQQDYTAVDLEELQYDAIPITSYKPRAKSVHYDSAYTHWEEGRTPARDHFRIVWRRMAANTGERTLVPAIVPPGVAHVHPVGSYATKSRSARDLLVCLGYNASLIHDFCVRSVPKSDIHFATIKRMPFSPDNPLNEYIMLRALRLTSLTEAYSPLWANALTGVSTKSDWAGGIEFRGREAFQEFSSEWSWDGPLRRASDRRQALVEIDAMVALAVGLSADELCTIYRTQFAVLFGYDRSTYYYDANGRVVPTAVLQAYKRKSEAISDAERKHTHPGSGVEYTYELPFVTLDREADMRQAYAHFETILAERTDG